MKQPVVPLSKRADTWLVGGKAHALGSLITAGFNVPAGFVVTTAAARLPDEDLKRHILTAFYELGAELVAVRSSATSEDGAADAWAGQLDTYLNVSRPNLLEKVESCQQSINSDRAVSYANQKQLAGGNVAVLVQAMIQSQLAGVAFSIHPVSQNPDQIIIEAAYGLGEAVVSGEVTPDNYVFSKKSDQIIDKNIATQTKQFIRQASGDNIWQLVGQDGSKQKMPDEQISQLAAIVCQLEKFYGFPVDVEWAFRDGQLYILQCRPITALK